MLQAIRDPLRTFTDFVTTEASYIIYPNDQANPSMYYVKSGRTGQIEYNSSDASDAIQYAVNNGSRIFLREGIYRISKSITLRSNVFIEGESAGVYPYDIGGSPGASARGVVLWITDTSVKHVFVASDPGRYVNNVVFKHVSVDGGGLVRFGNSGEEWGAASALIENVGCNALRIYPNGTDIFCLDIWHSLFVKASSVHADGMPVLRFATDFKTKSWNFGNSVFIDLFAKRVPNNVPTFHILSAGDPNKTNVNLLVFIRPQTLISGKGFMIDGETSLVQDVTIIGGNFETAIGLVVRGNVTGIYADLHCCTRSVRICKNSAGVFIRDLPYNLVGNFTFEYDGGLVKVYESDCETYVGTKISPPPTIPTRIRYPLLSYGPFPQFFSPYRQAIDLTQTSASGSTALGSPSNPVNYPMIFAKIPAGTIIDSPKKTFTFCTRFASQAYPPYLVVTKQQGWDQANLDIQVVAGWFNSANNCWVIIVDVINRTGSPYTLTSDLQALIVTYATLG
jgi:hypothetical protein